MLAQLLHVGKSDPGPVLLIEKSNQLGGQFRSESNQNGKTFDLGMHIYYETEIEEIDSVITSLLPDEEWIFLEGNRRDLAGIYFNGSLQVNSPYPDLTNLASGPEGASRYFSDLTSTLENRGTLAEDGETALEVLTNRFGSLLAEEIFAPILEKLYSTKPSLLHPLAARLTKMDRVVLFGENTSSELMKSDEFRKRIAYPSQLTLPNVRTSNYRGVYPKQFGFGAVVDLLSARLKDLGVEFLTNTTVTEVNSENGKRVSSLGVRTRDDNFQIGVGEGVVWSTDPYSLGSLLGHESPIRKGNKRKKHYVHVALRSRPNIGGLYYAYVFDDISDIFRITDYSSYCEDACSDGLYPISVEYWPRVDLDTRSVEGKVVSDLEVLGVINSSSEVESVNVSDVPAAFPDPSHDNVHSLEKVFGYISETGLTNLEVTGPLSKQGVFFLHEVLKSAYDTIKARNWV